MDASNPIIPNTLTTMSNILDRQARMTRQDFSLLRDRLSTQARHLLEVDVPRLPPEQVQEILKEYKETRVAVPPDSKAPLEFPTLDLYAEEIPISRKLDFDGRPIHPAGTNSKQGRVHLSKSFGSQPRPMEGVSYLAEILGRDVCNTTHIYTSGTRAGFQKRVAKQLGRKAVSLAKMFREVRGLGKNPTAKYVNAYLDTLMPRKPNTNWPGVHTDLIDGIMDGIKINFKSSAGAPYHRPLHLCADMVLSTGLPAAIEIIKNSKPIHDAMEDDVEFFISELKNKTDRYDVNELMDKTRPYCCLPAHWRLLFSLVSQGFSATHPTFDEIKSANAYGHSNAHGGMRRRYDWAMTANTRGQVIAYGDDALISIKRGSDIFLVAPDFRQMDGSIHREDIKYIFRWILSHLIRDAPGADVNFWGPLFSLWEFFAIDPILMCEGSKAYTKKNPDAGMLSGVPGTTLINTVKCATAWDLYLEHCANTGSDALDPDMARRFMAKHGLELKPGTFSPQRLPTPDEFQHGLLLTTTKFLGLQTIVFERNEGEFILCPHLPRDECVSQLMTPREDATGPRPSLTASNRTLYDRARGLMVTHCFTQPDVRAALYNLANQIDPTAIALIPQVENGLPPDHVSLPEFSFPDSSGFPDLSFCLSLYSTDEKQPPMHQFYPNISNVHAEMERLREAAKFKFERVAVERGAIVRAPSPAPRPIDPIMEVAIGTTGKSTAVNVPKNPPKGSKTVVVGSDATPPKRLPTLFMLIRKIVTRRGGACTVADAAAYASAEPRRVYDEALNGGLYLTGTDDGDIISLNPIATPFPTAATKQRSDESRIRSLPPRASMAAFNRKRRGGPPITFKPQLVTINLRELYGVPLYKYKDDNDMLDQFTAAIRKHFSHLRWRPILNDAKHLAERLEVSKDGLEWIDAAICECPTVKLARQSIAWAVYLANGYEIETGPDLANKTNPDPKPYPALWVPNPNPNPDPNGPWEDWDTGPDLDTQAGYAAAEPLAAPEIAPLGQPDIPLTSLPRDLQELSEHYNILQIKLAYLALCNLGVVDPATVILEAVGSSLHPERRRTARERIPDTNSAGPAVPKRPPHQKPQSAKPPRKEKTNIERPLTKNQKIRERKKRRLAELRQLENGAPTKNKSETSNSSGYASGDGDGPGKENVGRHRYWHKEAPPAPPPVRNTLRRIWWDSALGDGGLDETQASRDADLSHYLQE
ncbi:RdRp [Hubei permutotetra-like virus 7]|uniref:RdRp n=1 Tax=Hubei permutotetra-like virus 7 TaxID=1923081 RepID=UPI00090AE0A0|nr:RdRp [Hubei permutotetra-like virus 7]APG76936.1 RdRp [Hubei permutotetra-like virus 7]